MVEVIWSAVASRAWADHGPMIEVHSAIRARERIRVERGAISRVWSLSGQPLTIETSVPES